MKQVLIRVVPGAVVITIDGKSTPRDMTRQQLVDLAEDCLRAARETRARQAAEVA